MRLKGRALEEILNLAKQAKVSIPGALDAKEIIAAEKGSPLGLNRSAYHSTADSNLKDIEKTELLPVAMGLFILVKIYRSCCEARQKLYGGENIPSTVLPIRLKLNNPYRIGDAEGFTAKQLRHDSKIKKLLNKKSLMNTDKLGDDVDIKQRALAADKFNKDLEKDYKDQVTVGQDMLQDIFEKTW